MKRSRKVFCSDTPDLASNYTYEKAEQLAKIVKVADPGIIVEITSDADLHAALALHGSPVPQAGTIAESRAAFQQWIIGHAQHVSQGCVVDIPSLVLHHLSEGEAMRLVYRHWHTLIWETSLVENHVNFA